MINFPRFFLCRLAVLLKLAQVNPQAPPPWGLARRLTNSEGKKSKKQVFGPTKRQAGCGHIEHGFQSSSSDFDGTLEREPAPFRRIWLRLLESSHFNHHADPRPTSHWTLAHPCICPPFLSNPVEKRGLDRRRRTEFSGAYATMKKSALLIGRG